MDTLSHGLWSYIIFRRNPKTFFAVLFGILPDLLSWTIYLFYQLFTNGPPSGPPVIAEVPDWVWTLYGLTHSVIITAIWLGLIFVATKILRKKFPLFVLAYPLAILIDIPLHTREYLPTPFLYPLSDWKFDGVSWASPWFMIPNFITIIIILIIIFINKHRTSVNKKTSRKHLS